jgi:anti-anti-sigma regulatory factor
MKPSLVLIADAARPLATLEPAVWSAAAGGCERIAIDVDGLAHFGIPDVRELIRLLRIARERGTSLALRVGSPDRRRTLREMGLDRVFAIVA